MQNNLTKYARVKYIKLDNYWQIKNQDRQKLEQLKKMTKKYLNTIKYPLLNKHTGYVAKLNSRSIGKMIFPAPYFNPFIKNYINNLNALLKLKELFENSVYIDTLKPMKGKEKNPNIIGFHHFVAPLIMNDKKYRVLITAREKKNSHILYVISSEVMPIKFSLFNYLGFDNYISLKRLIKDIKIYNYEMKDYNTYNIDDINLNNSIKEDSVCYVGC